MTRNSTSFVVGSAWISLDIQNSDRKTPLYELKYKATDGLHQRAMTTQFSQTKQDPSHTLMLVQTIGTIGALSSSVFTNYANNADKLQAIEAHNMEWHSPVCHARLRKLGLTISLVRIARPRYSTCAKNLQAQIISL